MSLFTVGSIVVCDGNGKVTAVEPTDNNQIPVFDNTAEKGIKWKTNTVDSERIFKTSFMSNESIKTSTDYEVLSYVSIPASVTTINKICILSNMHKDANNYSVRVYDVTNDNIIGEATFTNSDLEIKDIGTLSNIPTSGAIFEIHVKVDADKSSKRKAYIKEVIIHY